MHLPVPKCYYSESCLIRYQCASLKHINRNITWHGTGIVGYFPQLLIMLSVLTLVLWSYDRLWNQAAFPRLWGLKKTWSLKSLVWSVSMLSHVSSRRTDARKRMDSSWGLLEREDLLNDLNFVNNTLLIHAYIFHDQSVDDIKSCGISKTVNTRNYTLFQKYSNTW